MDEQQMSSQNTQGASPAGGGAPPGNVNLVQGTSGSSAGEVPAGVQTDATPVKKEAPPKQGQQKEVDHKVTDSQKKAAAVKKEREIIRTKDEETRVTSRLSDLIVPLISLGVLVIVVTFVFIPFGTEIVDTRELTQEVVHDIRRNQGKIDVLKGIEITQLEDQLRVVSLVVRDAMEVSELGIEVEELARKNNLEPGSAEFTNTQDVVESATEVDREWVPLYAEAISGEHNYTGEFDDISNFLRDLRRISRTILSLGTVRVNRTVDSETGDISDVWNIQLLISGYTSSPAESAQIEDPVRTDVDPTLLEEIYRRAGKKTGNEDEALEEGMDEYGESFEEGEDGEEGE